MDALLKLIIAAPIIGFGWYKVKKFIKGDPPPSEPYKPYLSHSVPIKEPNAYVKLEREKLLVEASPCQVCGKPYLPKVEHQKYCSTKCRTRANSKKGK